MNQAKEKKMKAIRIVVVIVLVTIVAYFAYSNLPFSPPFTNDNEGKTLTTTHWTPVSAQETNLKIANRINEYLTKSMENGFSGSILIAKENEVILSKGYGVVDTDTGTPITPSTVFNIGSVTKQFTAAGIMKLVEEGTLNTTDTLSTFFPDLPADKRDITIHHLLTHSAGISNRAGGFRYDYVSRDQFLEELFKTPLVQNPGIRYEYANAGYTLLSAIIEIVSEQTYEEFLNENIFSPADMQKTGYLIPEWDSSQFAHSYFFDLAEEEWSDWGTTLDRFENGNISWYGIGKGDIQSTVEDLYSWHQELEKGEILSLDTVSLIETKYVAEQPQGSSYYGYGWAIFTSPWESKIVTHNGSNGYYFADFIRYVDDKVVVILLTNLNRDMSGFASNISRMVFNPDFQPPIFTKDPIELVFDFIRDHNPDEIDSLLSYYEEIQHVSLNEKDILNQIGLHHMRKGDHDWSVTLLKLNVQLFSDDGNLWDSLGGAYQASGQPELAIDSFEEALRIAPNTGCFWCKNAQERIDELMPID